MAISDILLPAQRRTHETGDRSNHFAPIVEEEPAWRARSRGSDGASAPPRVIATRWRAFDQQTREVSAVTPADHHVVAIILRNEDVRYWVGGRVVHDGPVLPGMFHVAEPGISVRCAFRGPFDVLHLHVPNSLIAEYARDAADSDAPPLCSAAGMGRDATVERLGRALLAAEETGGPLGQLYADCISTSIVARLLATARRTGPSQRSKVAELARWRLKRVVEYVEANLAEPLSLADLAAAAGLTRMHFAAQFRAATGVPPHEYVLRRRIERAQEMLLDDAASLVDVALSVGFQTQSHFTTVFKRFTGQPPRAWRQSRAATAPVAERQVHWRDSDRQGIEHAAI
jgi:AraC-like DNA-binding protein